jgi:hypothetical protein
MTAQAGNLELAKSYLQKNAKALGITANLTDIRYERMRKSLLGEHYYFKQVHNGVDVYHGEVIISISSKTSRIYRVYSTPQGYTFPETAQPSTPSLSQDQAIAIAWAELHVQGELLGLPRTSLLYYPDAFGTLRLTYRVAIDLSTPFGYWRVFVDAENGKILARHHEELNRRNLSSDGPPYLGPSRNYDESLAQYRSKLAGKTLLHPLDNEVFAAKVQGTGFIFNPDPRTALQNTRLHKDSPAGEFAEAYEHRYLPDITFNGAAYLLQGPYISIADFEPPETAPSSSSNGAWLGKRGDLAFNDVMAYYHIDKSQRYLQNLGFRDVRAVVNFSLQTDTNGLGGDDNSHYIPETKRLAFGQGCVPDTEDADVIVHEYGHAIQLDIAPTWEGGDSGAIGEGFGDYWAASYRLGTKNGYLFQPYHIFHWDSNAGADQHCWPGRRLDVLGARYNPKEQYGAHQGIEGGFIADELWSTPLYQSLVQAMRAGYAKKDIDRLVIESHFGLGAEVTMPVMAAAVVQTARMLYPHSTIADIFKNNFHQHLIL